MPRSNRTRSNTDTAQMVLTGTILALAVMGILYWAQKFLIPVALALFLAFLLTPIVMQVQRWGLHRAVAVIVVTVLSAILVVGIGWLVSSQVIALASEMPKYTSNIKNKIEAASEMAQDSPLSRLTAMFQDIGSATPKTQKSEEDATKLPVPVPQPMPVVIDQSEPLWLRWLAAVFGPATEFLGQAGLTIVLAIFVLLAREDLRNRFIRLVGHGRLTVTTKAVDDATQRLSRFLLMQLVINAIFGICVTVGLALIGVEYALLWGFLGGVLRYVPYIGSPIAALFPIVISIAQFEGWIQPGLVILLILGLELLVANVFEPLLFGHSIGTSAVALLIAAAFWAFLWGPIGLVLSGPMTVCLVVLGKYVPSLAFLGVLLGDEPALDEEFTYYQRLSARDEGEAADIVMDYVKDHPIDEVYDALLIPALTYAGRDLQRQGLDEDDVRFIEATSREILETIEETRQERKSAPLAPTSGHSSAPQSEEKVRILGIAARGPADEIALEMLRQLSESAPCEMKIAGDDVLASELLTMIEEETPAAVCIAALPPGGLACARFLCKRLRTRFPRLRILVGRWGLTMAEAEHENNLLEAGADNVRTTLIASRDDLLAWLPALTEKAAETKASDKSALRINGKKPANVSEPTLPVPS